MFLGVAYALASAISHPGWESAQIKYLLVGIYLRSQAQSGLSACEVNRYVSRVLTMHGHSERRRVLQCCTCRACMSTHEKGKLK